MNIFNKYTENLPWPLTFLFHVTTYKFSDQLGNIQTAISWVFVFPTHNECVFDMGISSAHEPHHCSLRSQTRLDLQGQSWQSRHRPYTLVSTLGLVSSAYQKHSLHVTHSLSGTCRVRKGSPFLLVLCWKWRAAGGCHHPGNVAPQYPPLWPSPGATPSTAPPWWWGLCTHTYTKSSN